VTPTPPNQTQSSPHPLAAPEANLRLAIGAYRTRRFEEAQSLLRAFIVQFPSNPQAQANLAAVLLALGKSQDALPHAQRALELDPAIPSFHNNLGVILQKLGRHEDAKAALAKAIELDPNHAEAHKHLGALLLKQGFPSKAIPFLQKAIDLRPTYVDAFALLATCHTKLGQVPELIQTHRRLIKIIPNSPHEHTNVPFVLLYDPDCSQRTLFAHHLRFAKKFGKPLYKTIQPHDNDFDPNRPLKIGYASNDFYAHPVSRFIEPVFANHDKSQFEVFLYSATSIIDHATQRIQSYGHTWRDIRKLSDEAAANLIRQDKIDILIDLMRYIGGHRLLLFAHKPAPLQLTYLGYPNTTGLSTMDYKITDSLHDPPGLNDRFYTEKLLRLDPCAWCYRPDDNAPPVNDLPALKNGFITFAALNRIAKGSPQIRPTRARKPPRFRSNVGPALFSGRCSCLRSILPHCALLSLKYAAQCRSRNSCKNSSVHAQLLSCSSLTAIQCPARSLLHPAGRLRYNAVRLLMYTLSRPQVLRNARPQCINPSRAPGPAEQELAMLHSYPFASRTLERRLPRATTITTSSSPARTVRPTPTMAAAAPTRYLAPWTGPTPSRTFHDPSEMISMPGRPHGRPGNPVEVLL
jgi:tetratricopeptide (TPR) repeat protein